MARRKQDEGKQEMIKELIRAYDIKDAKDLQDALKDLLGSTLESMLEAEMNEHLGYEKYETSDNWKSRSQLDAENLFYFRKNSHKVFFT